MNIVQSHNNKIILIGKKIEKIIPFYEKPINSKLLDMLVDNLLEELECWDVVDVKKK